MALRTNFNTNVTLRGARLNNLAAGTTYRRLIILGMDTFLHRLHLFPRET